MKRFSAFILCIALLLAACSGDAPASVSGASPSASPAPSVSQTPSPSESPSVSPSPVQTAPPSGAFEFTAPEYVRYDENGRTWYQVFVYSFRDGDGDGDGIGDIRGVTDALDYIQYMGFNGIWLSPINPSTTYHKYDVKDYLAIDPEYGGMSDFETLMAEAKARNIDVILDLVLNHTSDEHPWFLNCKNGDEKYEKYYNVKSEKGNGHWYSLPGGRFYEAQFWDKMPDLNLYNPDLREEIREIVRFWVEKGVKGFRLDAVKEFESGNAAANIEILSWFNAMCREIKPDIYLVGEDWDATDGLYDYYASGIDSLFAFAFAGADGITAKTLLNKNVPAGDYLNKLAAAQDMVKSRNENATRAPFLTNHDNPRSAGFLKRDETLIKTAWGMTLTEPGDAFVYYGEELGMPGSGKDENKRAPMYWSAYTDAPETCAGPPGMDRFDMLFPSVNEQLRDENSILNYTRKAVSLRNKYPNLGRGTFEAVAVNCENPKVGAARRVWGEFDNVVLYNLSADEAQVFIENAEILDFLCATGDAPYYGDTAVTLPGYTIAVLAA